MSKEFPLTERALEVIATGWNAVQAGGLVVARLRGLVSARRCGNRGLLLGHAMHGAQAPDEVHAVDADDGVQGKHVPREY